jgi:hypothetical protein
MNMLGKKQVGFVMQKEAKKRKKSAGNDAGKGIFAQYEAELRELGGQEWRGGATAPYRRRYKRLALTPRPGFDRLTL